MCKYSFPLQVSHCPPIPHRGAWIGISLICDIRTTITFCFQLFPTVFSDGASLLARLFKMPECIAKRNSDILNITRLMLASFNLVSILLKKLLALCLALTFSLPPHYKEEVSESGVGGIQISSYEKNFHEIISAAKNSISIGDRRHSKFLRHCSE